MWWAWSARTSSTAPSLHDVVKQCARTISLTLSSLRDERQKRQKHAVHERPRSSRFNGDYLRHVIGLSPLSLLCFVLKLYYRNRAAGLEASGAVLVLRLVLKLYYRNRVAASKRRFYCSAACTKLVLAKSSGRLGSKRRCSCTTACSRSKDLVGALTI